MSVGAQPSDTVMMLLKRSQMTDEEIAKLEQKKIDAKQKRKEQEILKKQEEANLSINDDIDIQNFIKKFDGKIKSNTIKPSE